MNTDPSPNSPPRVTSSHGSTGSEWEEDVSGAPTKPGVSQCHTLGLAPTCPYRESLSGQPHGPSGGFWGSPAASNPEEKQLPILGLAWPASLTSPKSLTYGFYITWLLRRLLGCKRAYFALSFHAALGTGCSSFSPALVLPHAARSDTSLPARGRVWGESRAGSCLCSALKLQPGRASLRSLPGEVPAPACLFFPQCCRRSALHPGDSPDGIHPFLRVGDSPKMWLFHPKGLHASAGERFGLGAVGRDGIQCAPLIPWLLLSPRAGFLDLSG